MKALDDIQAERVKQIKEKGFTSLRDHECHAIDELAEAGAVYALSFRQERKLLQFPTLLRRLWPWNDHWLNKKATKDRRQQLVTAAALIVAEIDHLDYIEAKKAATDGQATQEDG